MVETALLSIEDLAVYFPIGGGVFSGKPQMLRAVDGVSLSIKPGKAWDWSARAAAASRPWRCQSSGWSMPRAAG